MTTPPVNRQRVFGAVAFGFTLIAVIVALLPGCDDSGSDEDNAGSGSKKPGTGESGEGGSRSGSTLSSGTIETAIHFADVTKRTSIDFTYRNGEEAGNFAIIESLGGGAGLFDYDNDGDVDVVVPGGGHFPAARTISGHSTALFRNDGGFDFSDVSAVADINTPGFYSHGIAVTDFDSDGFLDFLVTGYGGLRLYHNMGDGTFEESAQATGLTDSQWSSSAAFADFNGDGHVDLYVAHYVNWSFDNHPLCKAGEEKEVCPPRSFDPLPDTLYLSNGDGSFRDASRDWGLSLKGKGLGVVAGDLDLNGTIEVYVGNDTVPNLLYKNKGKTFEDTSLMSGTSLSEGGSADGSMGVDLGDFNSDGLPDLWVANYESESFALYRNDGDCLFQPVSSSMGVTAVGGLYVGWGAVFLDPDSDGDLDVIVSNGHVIRHPRTAPLRQLPLVFQNEAGKRFVNVAEAAGDYTSSPHMGRGLAIADLDNDGDLDMVAVHNNEPLSVIENRSKAAGPWIGFRVIGRKSSRVPVGTIIRVQLADGSEQVRQLKSGSSYASSSDLRLFFGLGASGAAKSVTIRWPSGTEQSLGTLASGEVHTLLEPLK